MENPDRSQLHPAYILHSRPYSNSSLLVEIFTASNGRFPGIAKAVRSRKSGKAALLQPFIPLLINWSGRGEVKTLSVFEQNGQAMTLGGKALYCGFYINELIMRLLERADAHSSLFHYYQECLEGLAVSTELESVLRRFELKLLNELGYGLNLDREAETGAPVDPEYYYQYELEKGPVVAKKDSYQAIKGSTLMALQNELPLSDNGIKEARYLMRRVLAFYLGDRPLKSRELFRVL